MTEANRQQPPLSTKTRRRRADFFARLENKTKKWCWLTLGRGRHSALCSCNTASLSLGHDEPEPTRCTAVKNCGKPERRKTYDSGLRSHHTLSIPKKKNRKKTKKHSIPGWTDSETNGIIRAHYIHFQHISKNKRQVSVKNQNQSACCRTCAASTHDRQHRLVFVNNRNGEPYTKDKKKKHLLFATDRWQRRTPHYSQYAAAAIPPVPCPSACARHLDFSTKPFVS